MREHVVIIGAGGSGRGFLARLLQEDGAQICFVDKDEALICALRERGEYNIQVGKQPERMTVCGYEAFNIESEEALARTARADWVFVSVGEEHLGELAPFFEKAACKKSTPLRIIACENGICPKEVLRKALSNGAAKDSLVTQGVIFCTSIPEKKGALDIVSEDYGELPYDVGEALFRLPFAHFPATGDFEKLLQRKIYTYNCLSACIAYLGAYLRYEVYAEAANDPHIRQYCEQLVVDLNKAICKTMNVAQEEQHAFSQRAMHKFANRNISDTIYKNTRAAIRKLSPTERIIGAMRLVEQAGGETVVLELVAAAALLYLERNEPLHCQGTGYTSVQELFTALNPQIMEQKRERIFSMLEQLRGGMELGEILPVAPRQEADKA